MVKTEIVCKPLPSNTSKQTSVELIQFDEIHEPHYRGFCKLGVKIYLKHLSVVPVNEDFKNVVGFEASFKWKFIRQKNIIFVFGQFEYNDFALVFKNQKKCRKVYNAIYKGRKKDYVNTEILRFHFLNPILKKLSQNNDSPSRLKEIMEEWIEMHEGEEKREYLKLLNKFEGNPEMDDVKEIKEENGRESKSNRKRKFQRRLQQGERPSKKRKIFSFNANSNVIIESCFKIVGIKHEKSLHRKLLIFTSPERNECYEHNFYRNKNYFHHRCRDPSYAIDAFRAILDQDENGNECIKVEDKLHTCNPIIYDPENYIEMKTIKQSEYEIFDKTGSKRTLTIFDSNDRKYCYEYFWSPSENNFSCCGCSSKMRKQTIAEICHENTFAEYVRLVNDEHVCEKREYNPQKHTKTNEFVLSPNFEVQTKFKEGIERRTLVIFIYKSNRESCNTYFYNDAAKKFYCNGCSQLGRNIFATINQNEDGEDYVILSNAKHVCSPKAYIPQQKEIILRPPQFKFLKANEIHKSQLFIFDSNNPKLCYTFGENSRKYRCRGCTQYLVKNKRMDMPDEKGVFAVSLCKDAVTDEYYVRMLDGQKHKCKPQKYEPEKYEITVLKPKLDYILFQKKWRNKVSLGLAIFHSDDKSLCYEFAFHPCRKEFRCLGCSREKGHKTAKLHQNRDGIEFAYFTNSQKPHICDPIKYSSIKNRLDTVILEASGLSFDGARKYDESRIIRIPNFELQKNTKGVPDRRLIIFAENDRKLCYDYFYDVIGNSFYCKKCNIIARLQINGDEKYIIASKNKHACEPVEYQAEKEIIKAPNFLVFDRNNKHKPTKLITFTSSTKELCYVYTAVQNKCFKCYACTFLNDNSVTARLMKDVQNDEEYVQLLKNDHICISKKFILEEFQPKIIAESGFKLFANRNGKPNSKLHIFDPDRDGFVYEYFITDHGSFMCAQCNNQKKRVSAKLFENENGEKYLELSVTQHICESKEVEKRIIYDNFVVQQNVSAISTITIFDKNDKNFGYKYVFQKNNNVYYCIECKNKYRKCRQFTKAKLMIDESGKQSVELAKQDHICTIQNLKENKLIFTDYKFEENGSILIVNHPTDNNQQCYKYKYDDKQGGFCCIKCKEKKKKIINATFCKDNNNQEFLLLNDRHRCIPLMK